MTFNGKTRAHICDAHSGQRGASLNQEERSSLNIVFAKFKHTHKARKEDASLSTSSTGLQEILLYVVGKRRVRDSILSFFLSFFPRVVNRLLLRGAMNVIDFSHNAFMDKQRQHQNK